MMACAKLKMLKLTLCHLSSRSRWTFLSHNTRRLADLPVTICFIQSDTRSLRSDLIAMSVMSAMCFECLELASLNQRLRARAGDSNIRRIKVPVTSDLLLIYSGNRHLEKEKQNSETKSRATSRGGSSKLRLFIGLIFCFHPFIPMGSSFWISSATKMQVCIKSPRTPCWMKGLKCTPMLHLVTFYYVY